MNYKAMIKKQSTIIAIAVICLTIVTIGTSYALFFQVETNTNNQVVTAGTLDVSYGSGSSSITATELLPMSDDAALTSSTMTGTIYIENKGTLPANYEVAIGNDLETFNKRENALETDKLLSHEYLRVAAYVNGELLIEPTKLSELTKSVNNEDMYQILTGLIDAKENTGNSTMTVVLKIWIAENAPTEIIGDYVYLKMDVTSEVANVYDESKYTIVGTPTVTSDGIASNFSSTSFIKTGYNFSPENNVWEYHLKIKTGSVAPNGGIVGSIGTTGYSNGCTPFYSFNGNWIAYLSSVGNAWDIAGGKTIMKLETNTTYYLKAEFTGTQYIFSYSMDDVNWDVALTIDSTKTIYNGLNVHLGNNRGANTPFNGEIDLSSFYIKINGRYAFIGSK